MIFEGVYPRYLTELGQKQAAVTGQRLGELYARYLQVLSKLLKPGLLIQFVPSQKLDENANKSSAKIRLVKSTMTRYVLCSVNGHIIVFNCPGLQKLPT